VRSCNPRLGRFDSCAAPFDRVQIKPYVFPAARLTFVPGHRVDTTRAFNANRSWQGTYLGHRRQRAIVHWDLNETPTFGIDFAILEPAATKVEDSDR
jgi:hypothetical protein